VLANVGVITWAVIDALLVLWPVALIAVGVNMAFKNNEIVKAITWVLFLAVIISYSYFIEDKKLDGNLEMQASSQNVTFEKKPKTAYGEFNLSLGGLKLALDSNTANLMDAAINDPDVRHSMEYKNDEETAAITFDKKRYFTFGSHGNKEYECGFHLNNDIVWDMNIKTGAVNGTFDMADMKVSGMDLDVGAGNLKMVLGSKYERTRLKINAGASKLDVVLPESAGVRVKMNGALNKTNFGELNWTKQGDYYQSQNYDDAASRIDMDVNMGVGKLTIEIAK
jgi:hypothetical protein